MPGGKTKVKVQWFSQSDKNGDLLSAYCEKIPGNEFAVQCNWCKKTVSVQNQGIYQILQHSSGANHKKVADIKTKRNKNQMVFQTSSSQVSTT